MSQVKKKYEVSKIQVTNYYTQPKYNCEVVLATYTTYAVSSAQAINNIRYRLIKNGDTVYYNMDDGYVHIFYKYIAKEIL